MPLKGQKSQVQHHPPCAETGDGFPVLLDSDHTNPEISVTAERTNTLQGNGARVTYINNAN